MVSIVKLINENLTREREKEEKRDRNRDENREREREPCDKHFRREVPLHFL